MAERNLTRPDTDGVPDESSYAADHPIRSLIAPAGTSARVDLTHPRVPGEEEIERIVRDDDPVSRNYRITDAYHCLSAGMAVVVDSRNVNWSTFATWASKTAGESIRNEEVPRFFLEILRLEERVADHLPAWVRRLDRFGLAERVRRAALDTLQEVSSQVAEGNLKVFAELAPVFSRFVSLAQEGMTEQRLAELVTGLRPGSVESGGQELLRAAFTSYAEASGCPSDKERAERMLLANCRIGLHEQTRLQPNIEAAIDAPIDTIFARRLKAGLPRYVRGPLAWLLKFWVRRLLREVTEAWQEIATRYAMNLTLPGGNEIPLGGDVPDLPGGGPRELQSFDLPELKELFSRYHVGSGSNAGTAARNWARLDDRMGFIVALFRSRQQDQSLFGPPFADGEWERGEGSLAADP